MLRLAETLERIERLLQKLEARDSGLPDEAANRAVEEQVAKQGHYNDYPWLAGDGQNRGDL